MKLQTLFTSILLFVTIIASAQQKSVDVIYLKNGSIIKGDVTAVVPNESITVAIQGGTVLYLKMEEIDRMEQETSQEAVKPKREKGKIIMKEKGYFNRTQVGILTGGTDDKNVGYNIQTVNGYQVNRHFRGGVGVGVDHYSQYNHSFTTLFGSVSGDIMKTFITPFYFVDAGWGFLWDVNSPDNTRDIQSHKGGLMINPGLGVRFYTPSKVNFSVAVSMKIQKSEYNYKYTWDETTRYTEERTYKRLNFMIGMGF